MPVTFEALLAPDVRFSLLSLGLLLKKGWSVSFGSEPRVFLVLRFRGGDPDQSFEWKVFRIVSGWFAAPEAHLK